MQASNASNPHLDIPVSFTFRDTPWATDAVAATAAAYVVSLTM